MGPIQWSITLPKTNIFAPENQWLEGEFSFGFQPIFRGELAVSFKEGNIPNSNTSWWFQPICKNMLLKIGIIPPKFRGENKKHLKNPPPTPKVNSWVPFCHCRLPTKLLMLHPGFTPSKRAWHDTRSTSVDPARQQRPWEPIANLRCQRTVSGT